MSRIVSKPKGRGCNERSRPVVRDLTAVPAGRLVRTADRMAKVAADDERRALFAAPLRNIETGSAGSPNPCSPAIARYD